MNSNYKISTISYYVIALIISYFVVTYPPINTFSYDVFGYYMYLPLGFKYNDITIQNYSTISTILNTYHASETFYQAVHWDNGSWVMRYPIGLSVLFAPFYFIADGITRFTNYPADGFSRPYQLSILYGCLFYSLLGLYFIKKILCLFFNDKTVALTLIVLALGTNYFFHVSLHGQGTMSHNLLFSLYAIVIYLTIKWHRSYKLKHIIYLGIVCGIAALCRPSEIICVLIPLLYGVYGKQSFKNKIQLLLNYRTQIILFCLVLISVGFIQFAYWKYSSGKFIINPYGAGNPGEGLELLHPHILEVLFSFRKGWFVYTPLMIFTLVGFVFMFRNNKQLFTPVFIYFLINFYIVSSWSCWWYGGCFGVRGLIPSYAALSIPLAYFVQYLFMSRLKYLYAVSISLFVALNLFQSWQMYTGIMDSSNMSRPYYISTFLQTTPATPDQKKLLLQAKFGGEIEFFTEDNAKTHALNFAKLINFETETTGINTKYLCDSIKHSGKFSYVTNAQNPLSPVIELMHKDITKKAYTWAKTSIWVYSRCPVDSINAVFSIELKHRGYTFKYKGYALDSTNYKPNVWNKLEYYYLTPDDLRSVKDELKTFFTNKCNYPIYVDDLLLQSYEPIIDQTVF